MHYHPGCTEGEVRLVGGANNNEGRVEICLSNEWGTVCDQMWDTTDASVVLDWLLLVQTVTDCIDTWIMGYIYFRSNCTESSHLW